MGTIEKRKAPRIIVDYVSVEIDANHDAAPAEEGTREICAVKNISETGMMFESDKPFDPGKILRLTFALPDSPIVIRTSALVVHASAKRPSAIGVQYRNLAIAEQKLLRHFMNKALEKKA